MEFIDFLRQMDRVCENSDHCQNCPLKPFPCNDDIASIARNVDDQTFVGLVDRAHKAGAYRAVVVGNDLCGCLTGDAGEFDFNAEVLVLDGNHCGGLP